MPEIPCLSLPVPFKSSKPHNPLFQSFRILKPQSKILKRKAEVKGAKCALEEKKRADLQQYGWNRCRESHKQY